MGHRAAPTSPAKFGGVYPPGLGATDADLRQGRAGGGEGVGSRQGGRLAAHRLDEGPAPQDPLVGRPAFPAPAQGGHSGPAVGAAAQAAPLEFGPPSLGYPFRHEGLVPAPGEAARWGEAGKHHVRVLPRDRPAAHQRAGPAPPVPGETPQVLDDLRPEGIEVEIADELQEIGFFLDYDGLIAVLEEMAVALVAPACPPMAG